MDNIAEFNLVTGLVLKILYETFPTPQRLDTYNIAVETGLHVEDDPQDIHLDSEGEKKVECVIRWLTEEGFIRRQVDSLPVCTFETRYGLTQKGLQLLAMPSSLRASTSFGDALRRLAKDGMTEGARKSIGALVQGALVRGGGLVMHVGLWAWIKAHLGW